MVSFGNRLSILRIALLANIVCLLTLLGCQESVQNPRQTSELLNSDSPIRVYFTQPGSSPYDSGNVARVIADYISKAQHSLDVCAHELDSEIITQALLQAHRRGVRVRVVTETTYIKENSIRALQEAGIPVVHDQRDGALMHNKFIVFDKEAVWTGSMNFTHNCTLQNDNHGIYIADPRIAENYSTKFRWMFEQRQFGMAPNPAERIPNSKVLLKDGTLVENYFAPHDRVAERIQALIRQSSKSIHFLIFSFTHRGIADALIERAKNGVAITGVFERRQAVANHSMYWLLASVGNPIRVYLDGNKYNMHHKLAILDGQITIAGSLNWSVSADKDNDENVLILHSQQLAEQFEREFRRVLEQARAQLKIN